MIYRLNGNDLKSYGIYVSGSSGMLDGLKLKEPKEMDWDGYHGKVVDLSTPRYQHRELTLECFIVQPSKVDIIQKANDFFRELGKAGTQRLLIETGEAKPLVYEVYQSGGFAIKKRWRDGQNVGEFTLKLIEPEPVKRVLSHVRTGSGSAQVSITLTSSKLVTIHWGDGTKEAVRGTAQTRTHNYSVNGTYYIIMAGVIEEVTGFSTTATTVWTIL